MTISDLSFFRVGSYIQLNVMNDMFGIDKIEQLHYFAPLGLENENRILIQGRCPWLLYFTPLG
jgi:hypothetical protein